MVKHLTGAREHAFLRNKNPRLSILRERTFYTGKIKFSLARIRGFMPLLPHYYSFPSYYESFVDAIAHSVIQYLAVSSQVRVVSCRHNVNRP